MPQIIPLPDFDDLANTFWRLGALQSPAELHGYLAGQFAAGQAPVLEQWLGQAAEYIDCTEAPAGDDSRILLDLYTATQGLLADGELDFQLLLPDDEIDLNQRVESLGQWCQGFLTGFALGGKLKQQQQGQQSYSADTSEALSDMAAISQASIEDAEAEQEQSEQQYFEIVEYVRLAAITIFLECTSASGEQVASSGDQSEDDDAAVNSPADLFNKKLH